MKTTLFPGDSVLSELTAQHSSPQEASQGASGHGRFSPRVLLCISLVSLLYFVDIVIRARVKCFWVDELVTVYLCRLPSLKSTLTAVQQGADLNPPLFYVLTRSAQNIFGEGLVATRLPAIIGFYLFCLCLYLFISRRMGRIAGLVAGLFPFFTMAQYYAYEARPHGITLGWCGLALLCWQKSKDGPRRHLFLSGFCLSLTGALLTHVYAVFILVPFFIAEVYEGFRIKNFNWRPAVAMLIPLAVAGTAYFPLMRNYSSVQLQFPPPVVSLNSLQPFLICLMGRGLIVLIAAIVILGIAATKTVQIKDKEPHVPHRDLVLALGFVCLPIFGILSLRLSHGPFFFRYFLSSIAGFSIFLGAAISIVGQRYRKAVLWLPAMMVLLMVHDLGSATRYRINHSGTVEPSSGYIIGSPYSPLARDTALLNMKGMEDVLLLQLLNSGYIVHYAPPSLASRLYIGGPTERDPMVVTHRALADVAHVHVKVATFDKFFATHSHFFVYGSATTQQANPACGNCEQEFLNAGYKLISVQNDLDGVLFEYKK